MQQPRRIKKLKAFTLAEMLVTLALTSILLGFCYLSFNYIQQLLQQFRQQSFFITQLNELNKRGDILMQNSGVVTATEKGMVFKTDSLEHHLEFTGTGIVLKRFGRTDTFFMAPKKASYGFEPIGNPQWQNRLVNEVSFDVYFQKQKFHVTFHKNYDAATKLKLE